MTSTNIYCSCVICKTVFKLKAFFSHYAAKHSATYYRPSGKGTGKFITRCSCISCHEETTVQSLNRHITKCTKHKNKCLQCGAETTSKFCSHKCAGVYTNKNIDRAELSYKKPGPPKGSLGRNNCLEYPKRTKVSQCRICNKWFIGHRKTCSEKCLSTICRNAGKKSASVTIKRSKQEVELFDLCNSHFSNVTNNDPIFNGWDADILIHDTKTAILWNGPWHYKDMPGLKHSLKQVQNRDQIKKKEIESSGWTCLVFEDRYITPLKAFEKCIDAGLGVEPR